MCSNGKTYKQKNGMDYNVSEYAVICFPILTAINVSSKSDNIFTTVTMFKTLTVDIRESVDPLCRDGADAQYMQYLSKSHITSPQTRKKLI